MEKVCEVVLSDEQRAVLRMVVDEERNVFFTGSAGELFLCYGGPGGCDIRPVDWRTGDILQLV